MWVNPKNDSDIEHFKYTHPFFQTANIFLGEFICIIPYIIMRITQKKSTPVLPAAEASYPTSVKAKEKITTISPKLILLLAIPACFDVTASSLMFVALT